MHCKCERKRDQHSRAPSQPPSPPAAPAAQRCMHGRRMQNPAQLRQKKKNYSKHVSFIIIQSTAPLTEGFTLNCVEEVQLNRHKNRRWKKTKQNLVTIFPLNFNKSLNVSCAFRIPRVQLCMCAPVDVVQCGCGVMLWRLPAACLLQLVTHAANQVYSSHRNDPSHVCLLRRFICFFFIALNKCA